MELSLNYKDMERVIEALLFTSSEPLSIKDLKRNLPQNADIESIIETLQKHYETRGVNLKRVGNSIALRTAKDLDHLFIKKMVAKKNLSRAARETLAIVAYHQPVTKLEIEEIRGVSVGSGTIDLYNKACCDNCLWKYLQCRSVQSIIGATLRSLFKLSNQLLFTASKSLVA